MLYSPWRFILKKTLFVLSALASFALAGPSETMAKVISDEWKTCTTLKLSASIFPVITDVANVESLSFQDDILTIIYKKDAKTGDQKRTDEIIGYPRAVLITTTSKGKDLTALFDAVPGAVAGSPKKLGDLMSGFVNKAETTGLLLVNLFPVPLAFKKDDNFKFSITEGLLEATGKDKDTTSRLLAVAGVVRVDKIDIVKDKTTTISGVFQGTTAGGLGGLFK